MSHVVTLATQITDAKALGDAVSGYDQVEWAKDGTHRLYSGNVTGFGIKLKGWKYPVVVTKTGEVKYDNYGGSWGNPAQLDGLVQRYAASKVKTAARMSGKRMMRQQTLSDGSVKLVFAVR